MTNSEIVLDTVCKITGISKKKVMSRLRLWPLVEARWLFILVTSRRGYSDQQIAWALGRTRTTILKARKKAEDYITVSCIFADKYNKIMNICLK